MSLANCNQMSLENVNKVSSEKFVTLHIKISQTYSTFNVSAYKSTYQTHLNFNVSAYQSTNTNKLYNLDIYPFMSY